MSAASLPLLADGPLRPVGDYGVRSGFARAHRLPETPKPNDLMVLGEPYRPWRTAAAWYCWRAAEDKGLSA